MNNNNKSNDNNNNDFQKNNLLFKRNRGISEMIWSTPEYPIS